MTTYKGDNIVENKVELSKPEYGWARLVFTGLGSISLSYLDNVAFMLLDFIDDILNELFNREGYKLTTETFDGEGITHVLIADDFLVHMFSITDVGKGNIYTVEFRDFYKAIIKSLEENLVGWATFCSYEDNQELGVKLLKEKLKLVSENYKSKEDFINI